MSEPHTKLVLPHYIQTEAVRVSAAYTPAPLALREKYTDPMMTTGNYFTKYDALDRDMGGIISLEHCYARPINWTAESTLYKSTKTIFMVNKAEGRRRRSTNPLAPSHQFEETIDVETIASEPDALYDKEQALQSMEECEKFAIEAKTKERDDDWEETISRLNWNPVQNRVFNGMVTILNNDNLARLACKQTSYEPVRRRLIVNKSVKRVRHLYASVFWDTRLLQWLHHLLLDHLSIPYLGIYVDILQTLKGKLPTFVEKMMYSTTSSTRTGVITNESLFPILKHVWDPYANYAPPPKSRSLPPGAVIVMCPSAPSSPHPNHLKRQNKWNSLLGQLTAVVNVQTSLVNLGSRMTMTNCADQLLAVTRTRIQEVKAEMPGRPLILAGCNAGAALALQVAQVEHPACVICIGFSLLTADGRRGEPDDGVLDVQSPVVFVIGQCAAKATQEDVEDLRERLRVENGLIVVGAADDYLRVSKKKKMAEGVTQSVIDRMVVDQIGDFISGLQTVKQKDRKRVNSTGSSIDSEPPSPTPRITRPVGRPPGSKSRPKWTTLPGITASPPSPSVASHHTATPPPPPPPSTTDTVATRPNATSGATTTTITTTPHHDDTGASDKTTGNNKYTTYTKPNYSGSTLSNLLQGGYNKTNPYQHPTPRPPSGIRVLENIRLNPTIPMKATSNTNRPIDLSKITVINAATAKSSGNVVLMPDGKLKTLPATFKGGVGGPGGFAEKRHKLNGPPRHLSKYVTSKKQLVGRKPHLLSPPSSLNIMDLPIIFADDSSSLQEAHAQPQQQQQQQQQQQSRSDLPMAEMVPVQSKSASNAVGKFVFVNKPLPKTVINAPTLKRAPPVASAAPNPNKISAIIISRGNNESKTSSSPCVNSWPATKEVSKCAVNDEDAMMDLEKNLVATTIPKPEYVISSMRAPLANRMRGAGECDGAVGASGKRAPPDGETEEREIGATSSKVMRSESKD